MSDQLPAPATVEQVYMLAILRELQTVNAQLAALLAQGAPPPPPAGEIALREPRKRGK